MTGVPPYARTGMRSRSGLKRTAFYPTIGAIATDYKLHNTYLKPDYFTDPVEEYWACRNIAGLWDVTGEEVIEVTGPDALPLLDSLVPRDLTLARGLAGLLEIALGTVRRELAPGMRARLGRTRRCGSACLRARLPGRQSRVVVHRGLCNG